MSQRRGAGVGRLAQVQGVGLFLFVPLVLFLLVAHPEPIAISLPAGLVIMIGHRWLARPYMRQVAADKCLWSNQWRHGARDVDQHHQDDFESIQLRGRDLQPAVCRRRYLNSMARFSAFVNRWKLPLRLAIFLPLVALLMTLAATALGYVLPWSLDAAVASFRLVIGLTVNVAAWGWLATPKPDGPRLEFPIPFPMHNFFLLGVRALLWILRLIGLWWIVAGASYWF